MKGKSISITFLVGLPPPVGFQAATQVSLQLSTIVLFSFTLLQVASSSACIAC